MAEPSMAGWTGGIRDTSGVDRIRVCRPARNLLHGRLLLREESDIISAADLPVSCSPVCGFCGVPPGRRSIVFHDRAVGTGDFDNRPWYGRLRAVLRRLVWLSTSSGRPTSSPIRWLQFLGA